MTKQTRTTWTPNEYAAITELAKAIADPVTRQRSREQHQRDLRDLAAYAVLGRPSGETEGLLTHRIAARRVAWRKAGYRLAKEIRGRR